MAAITSSIIGIAGAGAQIIGSGKNKRDAKKDIENFQRQDLKNPYENISISTLKSDQQTQAGLSNFATSVEALQGGGARTVLAGLPKLTESNILLQNLISSDLEKQAVERDYAIARGEEKNQAIMERREENALLGLGQQYQTARQDQASGLTNLVTAGLSLGNAFDNEGMDSFGKKNFGKNSNFKEQPVATVERVATVDNPISISNNDSFVNGDFFGNNPSIFNV